MSVEVPLFMDDPQEPKPPAGPFGVPPAPPLGEQPLGEQPMFGIPPVLPLDQGPRRRRSSGMRAVIALTTVLGVFLAGVVIWGFVHHPGYEEFLPGDAEPVGPLITVRGAPQYKPKGDVLLVFIRERSDLNEWQYLWAKTFHDDGEILPRPPASRISSSLQDVCDMTDSQATAKLVALERLGYKVTTKPGVLIESILDGSVPAAGVLQCNDVIHTIDGQPTETPDALHAAISKHKPGDTVEIGYTRGTKRESAPVKLVSAGGKTLIGVAASARFVYPVELTIDTADIGGPSAGLAMTLSLLDELTKGNLTGGKRVAVTGTIQADASVGEIGAIQLKAIAARRRGAQIFIVPACQEDPKLQPAALAQCRNDLAEATDKAKGVKVIPVRTLAEALRALVANGGDPLPAAPSDNAKQPGK